MYTHPPCKEMRFAAATLTNTLNDKQIPQKMQKLGCFVVIGQIHEKRTKSVLKTLSVERASLSWDKLRMLVKICLTKQEKLKS